jgi:hypothetical protein
MLVTARAVDDIAELIFALKELNDGISEGIIKSNEDD